MELPLDDFEISRGWSNPERMIEVVQWANPAHTDGNVRRQAFHYSVKGTWGQGIYLAAAHTPLSAAHYGQAAASGALTIGRVFDATRRDNIDRFLAWAGFRGTRPPWDPPARFSSYADAFKRILVPQPDSIVFYPDEFNPHTERRDPWFLVWNPVYEADDTVGSGVLRIHLETLLLGTSQRFQRHAPNHYAPWAGGYSVDPVAQSLTLTP